MINIEQTLADMKLVLAEVCEQSTQTLAEVRAIRAQLDSLAEGEEDPDLSLDDLPEVDTGLIPLPDKGLG